MCLLSPLGVLLATGRPGGSVSPESIEIVAKRFSFEPNRIEVIEGQRVTLSIRSADGTHGLEIKKLGVKLEIPRGATPVTVSFTAPAPGTYDIACSEYCGRGHEDMKAKLIVSAKNH